MRSFARTETAHHFRGISTGYANAKARFRHRRQISYISISYTPGALGGRSHFLRFQWLIRVQQTVMCQSSAMVPFTSIPIESQCRGDDNMAISRSISRSRPARRTTIGCVRLFSAPCFRKRCCSRIVDGMQACIRTSRTTAVGGAGQWSREILPQSGGDLFQRPVDLIAGDN